ncbi:hypothetical protein HHI36_018077 [Cryptolaemus montrouzieri]|uniref:Uncharacterized protein n=1 Tax=Cryptolaemus montrouzieri TaxID=559131 RepID=A0ABD2NZ64_9CUCU
MCSSFNFSTGHLSGALNPHKLQDLAEKLNLKESDLDECFSDDELKENLIPGENVDGDSRQADEYYSSDDELLSDLIPASSKRWLRNNMFEPSGNLYSINYNVQLKDLLDYFHQYLSPQFFEDFALLTNMKEISITGRSLETSTTL